MDAQNAAESDQTRTAGASSPHQRRASEPDSKAKSPAALRASSPPRDARVRPPKASIAAGDGSVAPPDDALTERDSDAETIVLPGKHGHSPSKARKVRQEDGSESDGDAPKPKPKPKLPGKPRLDDESLPGNAGDDGRKAPAAAAPGAPGNHHAAHVNRKKRRLSASAASASAATLDKDRRPRHKENGSSGLSSAPASPPPQTQHPHQQQRRRRRSDAALSSPSDSEQHPLPKASTKASLRDKLKPGERLLPHKRKAPKVESDDEADARKARRQRTTSAGLDASRPAKTPSKPHDARTRSTSPHPRQHRRSASTQLPPHASAGLHTKKKRLPPPLHTTDYHSDDSSAGGTPHPRSSKLRSLAAPPAAESSISPAKMGPHKKHLDAHGQTLLARACARGEYEVAKTRLGERPEDLDVADYAGNTPLQIAAINGCEDIVKLLIEAGCSLDCVNYDKDTPLLDAVDNGHLGVIKLLLDAGVNPRKANVNGEEPLDRVTDDTENADEIRAALIEARKRAGGKRGRTSEDRHSHDNHDFAPESPRHSPVATSSLTGRRSGTVRSTKTRNDLLYMPLDDKTLRQAAGRGDEETVARILQVKECYDDPEAMVAAARGGHDLVIQLLLGLGGANPDPGPVASLQPELATPILAAIGQENIKVIELLLDQQGFDPTRRFKGETYYEIAKRRAGPNWRDEEHLLKNAYDEYKRSHRDGAKTKSPNTRRDRERERDSRRDEAKENARFLKRGQSSPTREGEARKKGTASAAAAAAKLTSPRESRRSDSLNDDSQKRAAGRVKDMSNVSDREPSPALSHKPHKTKRAESDMTGMSSEGEAAKPRRKLISKAELSRERHKQKRLNPPSSPHESRSEDAPEKTRLAEKYHDRTKALKRDGSRDHSSGDGPTKRHRASVTPDQPSDADRDTSEVPLKRRRLDADNAEKRPKRPRSPDGRVRRPSAHHDGSGKPPRKDRDDGSKEVRDRRDSQLHGSSRGNAVERSIHVKSEDVDVPMLDIEQPRGADVADGPQELDEKAKKGELEEMAAAEEVKEEERKRTEAEEKRKRDAEERRKREADEARRREADEAKKREAEEAKKREADEAKRREEEERARKAEEERKKREAEAKKREAEEAKKREAEEAKRREAEEAKRREAEEAKRREAEEAKRREAEEAKRREAEEAQRREEEERLRKAEEEKKRREEEEERRRKEKAERERREAEEAARREAEEKKRAEEERKRQEEEERRRREEAERLHREQLEREAAEKARREREEEERRERERRERAHREEMERKRAAREAEQRRLREEQERARLDKLPPLLRWLDRCPNPKTAAATQRFSRILGCRYDTIRPETNRTAEGREQWVLNTEVALLLGEKDLALSRYTAWEREPATRVAKLSIWRTEAPRYALTNGVWWDLGRQVPNCYGDDEPDSLTTAATERLKQAAWERFLAMETFFVKVSDLLYTVPTIPHLLGVKISVVYRELFESDQEATKWVKESKWPHDPGSERYAGHAPRCKFFVNGVFVGEELPTVYQTSSRPFPEVRVPRRGLMQVSRNDPAYERICKEQGLEHLLNGRRTPMLPNGVHSSPTSQTSSTALAEPLVNGTNGHSTTHERASPRLGAVNGATVNGIHDS